MSTSHDRCPAFAVWITGLPASGKSTLAGELARQLLVLGVDATVLESDVFRRVFTPNARYEQSDRDNFYKQLTELGTRLTRCGIPVIFDATANLRRYRDAAREGIPRFLEVHVVCSLATCEARDPKGIYRFARGSAEGTVPGLQVPYEAPTEPEVTVNGETEAPAVAASRVVEMLRQRGYIPRQRPGGGGRD